MSAATAQAVDKMCRWYGPIAPSPYWSSLPPQPLNSEWVFVVALPAIPEEEEHDSDDEIDDDITLDSDTDEDMEGCWCGANESPDLECVCSHRR